MIYICGHQLTNESENTFEIGADITPSLSFGVPMTSAQYFCTYASHALFHVCIEQHMPTVQGISMQLLKTKINHKYMMEHGILNQRISNQIIDDYLRSCSS